MARDPKKDGVAGMPAELRAYAKTEPNVRLVQAGHTAEFRAALAGAIGLRGGSRPGAHPSEAREAQARGRVRAAWLVVLLFVGLVVVVAVGWRALPTRTAVSTPAVAPPIVPTTALPVVVATSLPTSEPPPAPTLAEPVKTSSARNHDTAPPSPAVTATTLVTTSTVGPTPVAAPPKPSTPAASAPQAVGTALGGPRTFGN